MSYTLAKVAQQSAPLPLDRANILHLYNTQNRVHIIYKLGPDLYITDWLSHKNHKENSDRESEGMRMNMNAINMSVNIIVFTPIQDIQTATCEDVHLQEPKAYII